MMRFGMDEEQSRDYIARIADIIEPREPLVVYLDNPDVRATVAGMRARGHVYVWPCICTGMLAGDGTPNREGG